MNCASRLNTATRLLVGTQPTCRVPRKARRGRKFRRDCSPDWSSGPRSDRLQSVSGGRNASAYSAAFPRPPRGGGGRRGRRRLVRERRSGTGNRVDPSRRGVPGVNPALARGAFGCLSRTPASCLGERSCDASHTPSTMSSTMIAYAFLRACTSTVILNCSVNRFAIARLTSNLSLQLPGDLRKRLRRNDGSSLATELRRLCGHQLCIHLITSQHRPMESGLRKRTAPVKPAVRRIVGVVWGRRRWIYAAWILLAVARIPARTGFRLEAPACDWRLTLDNLALSLTKVPHIVLFGAFFLLTLVQFDRVGRTSLSLTSPRTFLAGSLSPRSRWLRSPSGAVSTGSQAVPPEF